MEIAVKRSLTGKSEEKRERVWLLDLIRGVALLNMVVYHALWDLVFLYGISIPWYQSRGAYIWQQLICCTFILLSGFCWPMGSHPLRRGGTVFAGGVLVSAVTLLVLPGTPVVFGILTLLGSCMLLLAPFNRLLARVNAAFGAVGSLLLFVLCRKINDGVLGIDPLVFFRLPEKLYHGMAATYLGFTDSGFYSSDYFPLLPWLFLFLAGYFANRFLSSRKKEISQFQQKGNFFQFLGQHSLTVYLLHQPVIYLVLEIFLGRNFG